MTTPADPALMTPDEIMGHLRALGWYGIELECTPDWVIVFAWEKYARPDRWAKTGPTIQQTFQRALEYARTLVPQPVDPLV
jgi:hypothetical protein